MREQYANPRLEQSARRIEDGFQKAYRKILKRLRQRVKAIKAGQGTSKGDALVAAKMRSFVLELEAEIDAAGYKLLYARQGNEIKRLADEVAREARKLGIDASFSQDEKAKISLLTRGAHRRLSFMRTKIASDLEQVLIHSVTGEIDTEDIIANISDRLDVSQSAARAEAEKAVAAFHAQTRAEHSEANGVRWFWYRGPQDDRTRDFCGHFVGTRVTMDILDKYAGSYGRNPGLLPVYAYLGGYNCRHELVPLPGEKAWLQYPVGPRGSKAYRESL